MSDDNPKSTKNKGLQPKDMVDHYRIIRPLGAGGMAEVYLARDTMLGRKVALKIVHPKRSGKDDSVKRFLFEAKATARFNHPHIVTIYNVGMFSDGPYLALEYLEGQTLRDRLDQERLGTTEAMRIAKAIAEALATAHNEEILHRDLKPDNVMLARDGRLRVLDFGLSRLLREEGSIDSDSDTNKIFKTTLLKSPFESHKEGLRGTPAYMSPEQWRAEEIGPATDVWALGLILHEMLFGRHPYHDVRSMHVLASRVASPDPIPQAEQLGNVPYSLLELLTKCLSKVENERPLAKEIVQELEHLLTEGKQEELTGMSPFRGLSSFEEVHSPLFFGRKTEVTSFIERLRQEPIIPVVGPSGAGKSSFIKAGVIPRLREKGPLLLIQLRPGRDPFLSLASRLVAAWKQPTRSMVGSLGPMGSMASVKKIDLADSSDHIESPVGLANHLLAKPGQLGLWLQRLAEKNHAYVILFVDQLEELCAVRLDGDKTMPFSTDNSNLDPSAGVLGRFMRAIASAADDPQMPVRVILTIREEFLTRLMTSAQVREALSRIMVLSQPGRSKLITILESTVRAVGYKFEIYLATEIVRDLQETQSRLSLLQFAGQTMWQNRESQQRQLTRAAYEEMGGVSGALVQHAEGVLKSMTSEEIRIAKEIFLRLITEDKTRRIISEYEVLVGLGSNADRVLTKLVESSLVVVGRKTVEGYDNTEEGDCELVHEALIAQWDRLNEWIDEGREEVKQIKQLKRAAKVWSKRGKRTKDLWGARALQEVASTVEQADGLSSVVKGFLMASEKNVRLFRLKLAALIPSTIILSLAAAWFFTSQFGSTRCTESSQDIGSIWNVPVKIAIKNAFSKVGVSHANETSGRVSTILDAYTKKWVDQHTQVCESTQFHGRQPELVMQLRMECLQRRKTELNALLRLFTKADALIVHKAVQASSALTRVEVCADVKSLEAAYSKPKSEKIKLPLTRIRKSIARVQALSKTGKHPEGIKILKLLETKAQELDYLPVQAEISYQLGRLLSQVGKHKEAERYLLNAAHAAGDIANTRLAASAMASLVLVVGSDPSRLQEGLTIARDARILFGLVGKSNIIRAELLENLGILCWRDKEYGKAIDHYRRALDIRTNLQGQQHPDVVMPVDSMGHVYQERGQHTMALQHYRRALTIRQKALGPEHPDVAISFRNIGSVYSAQNKHERALEHLSKSLKIAEKTWGSEHTKVVPTLSSIGNVYLKQDRYKDAFVLFDRAVSLCANKGCDSKTHGHCLFNLARTLVATNGDRERAIKLAEKAQTIFEKTPIEFHNELADVDVWLEKHHQGYRKKLNNLAVPLKQVNLSITKASHKVPAGER